MMLAFLLFMIYFAYTSAKCPEIACESGLFCDYNTGICRRFRIPGEGLQQFALDWNKCQDVICPPGYHCDGTSGVCVKVIHQAFADNCEGIICPPGFNCFDSKCVKDEPITTEDIDPDPLCRDVKCPTGFTCSTLDGICHPHARHYSPDNFNNFNLDSLKLLEADSLTLMQCPQNAHYEECAAACTSTCMDIRPDCKQHDYDCIRSCVCDDGYVQVSVLNTTCVPAQKCLDVAKEDDFSCQNLQCGPGMKCLDGFCNPENCPPALKPPMTVKCQKIVIVRDRRNCVSLLNECSLKL